MWSQVVLCLLVGIAYASQNPTWTENKEFVYKIEGRTLTGFKEISNQFAGFFFRGNLKVQPRSGGKLQSIILNAEYSPINKVLDNGWKTDIPEEELTWKPLGLSQKPFTMNIVNGKIHSMTVSKKIPIWELNMVKGVASVFQLNTNGENVLPSTINVLPNDNSNNAIFMAMEDTVSGQTETLYEIRPVPEHLIQGKLDQEGLEFPQMSEHDEIIEVFKHMNFSNQEILPVYAHGFGNPRAGTKPGRTHMGDYFTRETGGRALLVGSLRHYTVLQSSIVSRVMMKPTVTDEKFGQVISVIVAKLEDVKSEFEKIESVTEPVELDNLVYEYDPNPFSSDNSVSGLTKRLSQDEESQRFSGAYDRMRTKRSASHDFDTLEQPEVSEAARTPFLGMTTGYVGKSIKNAVNVVKEAQTIIKKLASDILDAEKDHHEKSLERFSDLVTLIRLMNREELDQLSHLLYTQAEEGPEAVMWTIFLNAAAESGTGTALLLFDTLIESDKIDADEAAEAIATLADSAVHPTMAFMKSFFDFVKKDKVMAKAPLNETVLIAFGSLARTAVIDKSYSRSEFPVKSFGSYRTEEHKHFIREEVIPYITEMLHQAVERAEARTVQVIIKVLGSIADLRILTAFEPYLEGKKQASQFQRFLMIVALDELAMIHPEETGAVLYRVYQNPGEHPAVRIAAVYKIMSCEPTAELFQLMAQNTNIETNEHVNSAVKHTIVQLSQLDANLFPELKKAAQAAVPLLTESSFGLNYGANYLRDFVKDELNKNQLEIASFIPSEDSYTPKGYRYSSLSSWNGFFHRDMDVQAYVSSIDQLLDVAYQQTKKTQQEMKEQERFSAEQLRNPWSSISIAKKMNMKAEEREQLEGYLSWGFGPLTKILNFDNETIEQAPKMIRKIEEEARKGKKMNFLKFTQTEEMTLAVPTAMGIPLVYTYKNPMLVKFRGQIQASADPQISDGSSLHAPNQVKLTAQISATVSGKIQGRLAFVTPFEHKVYISGFDKHLQANLPKTQAEIELDLEKQTVEIMVEPKQETPKQLLHYRTWPYTGIKDLLNFEPLTSQQDVKEIEPRNMQGFKTTVGEKSGFALDIELNHERAFVSNLKLVNSFSKNGLYDGLRALWVDSEIQSSQLNIRYNPQKSFARKITLKSRWDEIYIERAVPLPGPWKLNDEASQKERQEQLMQSVSAGIQSAKVVSLDTIMVVEGNKQIKYILTAAAAKSNIDPQSRAKFSFKRTSRGEIIKDYEAHILLRNEAPNTNGLDVEFTLRNPPKMETEIEAHFGYSKEKLSIVKVEIKHNRSEERVEFLRGSDRFETCKQEMEEGNKALNACTQLIMEANLLDRVEIKVKHENLKEKVKNLIERVYDAVRVHLLPVIDIKARLEKSIIPENEIMMKVKFHEDLRFVNVTVQTKNEKTKAVNIPVNEIAREIVVAHPVFHVRSRVLSSVFGVNAYRDFCTIDNNRASTFSNKTYPAQISNEWTLMALYAPKQARDIDAQQPEEYVAKLLKTQTENLAILVRKSQQSPKMKEFKIVVSSPETNFKVVEINLIPSAGQIKVSVNGQLNDRLSFDLYQGFIQIYPLPNKEAKVEIRGFVYVIYDGERARVTAVSDKLKDATRGICGQFNDQDGEDFLVSENCIARKPKKFVKSFEVQSQEGEQVRQQFSGNDKQCVEKQVPLYVNVITSRESRRKQHSHTPSVSKSNCRMEQTRYVHKNGQICFTTVPLTTCKSGCRPEGSRLKTVGVHCVARSNVSDMWKKQIDNDISPDFSTKRATDTAEVHIPEECHA
uniref:Vg2 n=1 Tax=Agasicles hygrophila TaxID=715812 RepID=A0A516KLL7_9CUCU|nr:Vitellogenin 2 [Agasicles hygrophila]QES69169.1 Vg2 [Agasicles hygrophila]